MAATLRRDRWPLELVLAAGASAMCAVAIVLAGDLKPIHRYAGFAALLGAGVLAALPNRRMLLVVAWVLVHPLSLEKVFFLGAPLLPDFRPPILTVSASDAIFALVAAALLLEWATEPRARLRWPAAAMPLLALSAWTLTVALARGVDTSSALAVAHAFKMLLFVVVLSSAVRTRDEAVLLFVAMGVALLLQVALVCAAALSGHSFSLSSHGAAQLMSFSGQNGSEQVRATGTVGHVNQEATFLTFFSLPLIGLLAMRNPRGKLAAAGLLGATGLAVILTYSRGAWASIALGGVVMVAFAKRRSGAAARFWRYAVPAALAATALLAPYAGRIGTRLLHGDDGASASRTRANLLALDLTALHPLAGVGPGNFARATLAQFPMNEAQVSWVDPAAPQDAWASRFGRLEINEVDIPGDRTYVVPLPPHNKFLLILCELGLVGLALFLWFQWRIFVHLRRAMSAKEPILSWTAIGLAGAFAATQLYMNLDLFADDKTVQILLFPAVLAIIVDRWPPQNRRRRHETR